MTNTPDMSEKLPVCERLRLIAKASNDYAWFLTHNPNAEPAEFLHAIREWAEAILPIAETPTEAADLIQQQQATIERLSALVEESLYHLRLDEAAKAYHERSLTALGKDASDDRSPGSSEGE